MHVLGVNVGTLPVERSSSAMCVVAVDDDNPGVDLLLDLVELLIDPAKDLAQAPRNRQHAPTTRQAD